MGEIDRKYSFKYKHKYTSKVKKDKNRRKRGDGHGGIVDQQTTNIVFDGRTNNSSDGGF